MLILQTHKTALDSLSTKYALSKFGIGKQNSNDPTATIRECLKFFVINNGSSKKCSHKILASSQEVPGIRNYLLVPD